MNLRLVKWGKAKCDHLSRWTLSLGWMQTYYGETREYAEKKLKKRFRLTDDEIEAGLKDGFASVMRKRGEERKVTRKAIGCVLLRATMAATVSAVCDLPQFEFDWWSITLNVVALLVDIIFFQRQIFLVIQELEILYVGRDKSEFEQFEYEARQRKQEQAETAGDTVFQWLGWIVKNGLGYVARLFRQSLKRGAIQVMRALGLRVTNEMAETTTTVIVTYVVSSLVAGMVTYVMFVAMGWRMMAALRKGNG